MKQKRYRYIFILAAFTLTFLSSCVKETIDELTGINGIKVSNEFSAPLLNLTVGMQELYQSISNQAGISERPDKLLFFTYRDTIIQQPKQLVDIPAIPFNYKFQMTAPIIAAFTFNNGFDLSISDSAKLPSASGQELKLIRIKEGSFEININNTFKHNTTIEIAFPNIKKNGIALTQTINFVFGTTPNPMPAVSIDLAGYDLDLSNGGFSSNTIPFSYRIAMVRNPANPTTVNDELNLEQTFNIKSYSLIRGYLGYFNILNQAITQKIDLFEQQKSGQFLVNDPRLVIRVYNSFGVPLTGRIANLRVVGQDGSNLPVEINPFKDTFSFPKPKTPGETVIATYVIDKTNSNIDLAINSSPSFIKFNIYFDANYNKVVTDNFMIDTASFRTDLDFEVPMDIKIVDYISETEQKQTPDTANLPYIKSIGLSVRSENGLPFDIYTQLIYTNDTIINGKPTTYVVDSLFSNELTILGANVDGNGNVVTPRVTESKPVLEVARYKRIMAADNMVTRSRIVTSTFNGAPGFVKIYTNQKMNVKIGADIKLTYKSNEQ